MKDAIFSFVASFAEAWIETVHLAPAWFRILVASFAEAWIETTTTLWDSEITIPSPPSRRRGLKRVVLTGYASTTDVASFAEAWIETS